MAVETVKMSSKGQVVIPWNIRKELRVDERSVFAVMSSGDSVVLKKISTPSKEELIKDLEKIAKEGKKRAAELGIKEIDISCIKNRRRKEKRKWIMLLNKMFVVSFINPSLYKLSTDEVSSRISSKNK